MSRFNVYNLDQNKKDFFEVLKSEETTPIRNSQITEYLSKSEISFEYNNHTWQALVRVKGPDTNYHSITFSQQEGNCNGLWFSRPSGNPDIVTHLAKNIMSLLGDNVGLITHHSPSMEYLEKSGWTVVGEHPSNRGYSYPIKYAIIHLPPDYMASKGFAIFTKSSIKNVQKSVGDAGTVLDTKVVITDRR